MILLIIIIIIYNNISHYYRLNNLSQIYICHLDSEIKQQILMMFFKNTTLSLAHNQRVSKIKQVQVH